MEYCYGELLILEFEPSDHSAYKQNSQVIRQSTPLSLRSRSMILQRHCLVVVVVVAAAAAAVAVLVLMIHSVAAGWKLL